MERRQVGGSVGGSGRIPGEKAALSGGRQAGSQVNHRAGGR